MAYTDFQTNVGKIVKVYKNIRAAGAALLTQVAAADVEASELSLGQRLRVAQAMEGMGNRLKPWNESLRDALIPHLEYGMEQIGRPFVTPAQAIDDLVKYMVANGYYVADRAVGYGAAPSDSASGVYRRLTVNKYGQKILTGRHNGQIIKARVRRTESSGAPGGRTEVDLQGSSAADSSSLSVKGNGANKRISLVGPSNPQVVTNAVLSGNATVVDGDAITDGTASTGGVRGWDQTRTGVPVVRVKATGGFRSQPYGIGIKTKNTALKIEQSMSGLVLSRGIPIAIMTPIYLSGAAIDCDITQGWGSATAVFTEADLSNGAWVYLVSTLDKYLYPENFAATAAKFSLNVVLNNYTDSGQEVILGGFYVATAFQLEVGGEWHVQWEYYTEAVDDAEVAFSADTQDATGELADSFAQAFPEGPSLPISGSSLWSPAA